MAQSLESTFQSPTGSRANGSRCTTIPFSFRRFDVPVNAGSGLVMRFDTLTSFLLMAVVGCVAVPDSKSWRLSEPGSVEEGLARQVFLGLGGGGRGGAGSIHPL